MKKGKSSKVVIEKSPRVRYIASNDFWFQWCCKCKLRHIWHIEVTRGQQPEDDVVKLTGANDEIATKLRKFYDKHL